MLTDVLVTAGLVLIGAGLLGIAWRVVAHLRSRKSSRAEEL